LAPFSRRRITTKADLYLWKHRFVQSAIQQGLGKAKEIMRKLCYEDVDCIRDMLKGSFGDRLRSFD
jgi:hypothetical protein